MLGIAIEGGDGLLGIFTSGALLLGTVSDGDCACGNRTLCGAFGVTAVCKSMGAD